RPVCDRARRGRRRRGDRRRSARLPPHRAAGVRPHRDCGVRRLPALRMIVRIRHRTRFVYDSPAYESHNELRLAPVDGPGQRCLDFALTTNPEAAVVDWVDAFGNRVHAVSVHPPHEALAIVAESVVERTAPAAGKGRDLGFAEFLAEDEARLQEYPEFLAPS